MGDTQSNPIGIHNRDNQTHKSIMHETFIMHLECNAWSYNINNTKSNPKYTQQTQKPKKKISKTQNLGVNAWMHENIVRRRVWWLGQKLDGLKDFSEGEVFGLREERNLLRER